MDPFSSTTRNFRLLAAFAHPDDEAYGPAGTIKAAVDAGARVRIVIATRGEAASLGLSRDYPPDQLARIRQAELQASARILGAELAILGYPDKGVEAVGSRTAVADLVREIRQFHPDVLLTFHPNGLSGHSDHLAMTEYVNLASAAATDPDYRPDLGAAWRTDRVYYFAISDAQAALLAQRRRILSIPDADSDLALDVHPWLATKHRACLAHTTQLAFYQLLEGAEGGLDAYWGIEHLVLRTADS